MMTERRGRDAILTFFSAIAMVVFAAAISACSARYQLVLRESGAADAEVSAALEPLTARLVANLADFGRSEGTGASAGPVLDAADLSQTLRGSPGVTSVSFRNPDAGSVAGTVSLGNIERFLSSPADGRTSATRFVRIERSGTGGRLTVSIDRQSGAALLASLSPDIVDYVSALMAPVATGENIGRSEYLALVETMYGKGIAAEIAGATIRASVQLPGDAVSVRGGSFSGRRAEFLVPLVDLLVLEKTVSIEAAWK
jgi:hypothetical protein